MTKDTRTYWEKLQDPRWQKVRLEVLNRANFACEKCGATERTLHVHHGYYTRATDPWGYPLDTLHCFCEWCHDGIGDTMHDIHIEIARLPANALQEVFRELLRLREVFPRTYKPSNPGYWDNFKE